MIGGVIGKIQQLNRNGKKLTASRVPVYKPLRLHPGH